MIKYCIKEVYVHTYLMNPKFCNIDQHITHIIKTIIRLRISHYKIMKISRYSRKTYRLPSCKTYTNTHLWLSILATLETIGIPPNDLNPYDNKIALIANAVSDPLHHLAFFFFNQESLWTH